MAQTVKQPDESVQKVRLSNNTDLAQLLKDDLFLQKSFPRTLRQVILKAEREVLAQQVQLKELTCHLSSLRNLYRLTQWASQPTPGRKRVQIPGVGLDVAVATGFVVLGVANLWV